MASDQMKEYERKRLENIKRNNEMVASLKIPTHVAELSASFKRLREEKSYKQNSEKKKKSETSPAIIRRSLRTRGMPPDSSGLPGGVNDLPVNRSRLFLSPISRTVLVEDLSMEVAYLGEDSPLALVKKLVRFTRKIKSEDEKDHLNSPAKFGRVKLEESIDPHALKVEYENGYSKSSRMFGSVKLEEPMSPHSLKVEYEDGHSKSSSKFERVKLEEPIDPRSLKLEYENVARVVPGRISSVRFFPTTEMTMVVAGSKYGHLGFWDVNPQTGDVEDVIHLYQPHSAPVCGLSVHPFALSKVYSCCYNGLIRGMNVEREKFELLYSSNSSLNSLAQQPNDVNCLYFGEEPRVLNMFDERVGKILHSWPLHLGRINSIDFSSTNTKIMATSSTDGLACIWDLRNINVKSNTKLPEHRAVWTVKHQRTVRSAYFSPSGRCLATTSLDDKIGVLGGVNFEDSFMIPHDNWTNRWISSFRAVWGWDDTHLYIGNMKRRVDVLSVTQKKMVHKLESSHMSAIPCRYDAHPYTVGMLAGATSGGQIYIWTASS